MVRSLRPGGVDETSCAAQEVVRDIYLHVTHTRSAGREGCVMSGGRTPEAGPGLDPALVAELNHEISRHARLLHVLKSSLAHLVPAGLEPAAFGLLVPLVKGGPRRQGELADMCLL